MTLSAGLEFVKCNRLAKEYHLSSGFPFYYVQITIFSKESFLLISEWNWNPADPNSRVSRVYKRHGYSYCRIAKVPFIYYVSSWRSENSNFCLVLFIKICLCSRGEGPKKPKNVLT